MKYKLLTNAWVWFGVFCVGLFFVTYWGLSVVVRGLTVSEQPNYSVSSLKVQPNYGNQTEQGYKLQPTTNPNSVVVQNVVQGKGLVELWAKDNYGVTAARAVLSHTEPVQQVLYYETPQLSPGLERL